MKSILKLSRIFNGDGHCALLKTGAKELGELDEIPNEYFRNAIKKAREERKQGKVSPIFDNAEDAIAWLHK
jgi:hypothetical protein